MRTLFFSLLRRTTVACAVIVMWISLQGIMTIYDSGFQLTHHDATHVSFVETQEVFALGPYDLGTPGDKEDSTETQSKLEFIQTLEWILRAMYLLLWPLLAIAGASLDNTLVYGNIFYLNTMLRKFWQIIRTFAYIAIGLIFVGSILVSFFNQNSESLKLKEIAKKTFVAGILIQMSRWLMAVLIDFSTIGVLSIGLLPLNVVGYTADAGDPNGTGGLLQNVRSLKIHGIYNLDGTVESNLAKTEHNIFYSCAEDETTDDGKFFLPCRIHNNHMIGGLDEKGKPLTWASYKEQQVAAWSKVSNTVGIREDTVSDNWCTYDYDLIKYDGDELVTPDKIKEWKELGKDEMERRKCSTLPDLTKGAAGVTGPLYNLYTVLLRSGRLAVSTDNKGLVETGLSFLLKVIVGLALLLPLFALAVVLIVRAVLLWLLIAFSPLLVLLFVYKFEIGGTKVGEGDLVNVSDVMGLVFMPVFVVFAVSLSLVFLNLIGRPDLIDNTNTCENNPATKLGCVTSQCEGSNTICYNLCDITTVCFTDSERTIGANIVDVMGWLVSSMFGIALMWTLIFFALKSSKMTRGIVDGIESIGTQLMKSTPLIPMPGSSKLQSIGSLERAGKEISNMPRQKMVNQYRDSGLGDSFEALMADMDGSADKKNEALGRSLSSSNAETRKSGMRSFMNNKVAANTTYTDYSNFGAGLGALAGTGRNMSTREGFAHEQVQKEMWDTNMWDKLPDNMVQTTGALGTRNKTQLVHDIKAGLGNGEEREDLDGNYHIIYTNNAGKFYKIIEDKNHKYVSGHMYDLGGKINTAAAVGVYNTLLEQYEVASKGFDNLPNMLKTGDYAPFVQQLQQARDAGNTSFSINVGANKSPLKVTFDVSNTSVQNLSATGGTPLRGGAS